MIMLIVTLLLAELTSRAYLALTTQTPFFKMDELIFYYYPELKLARERYRTDSSDIKVLILGGSVVDESIYCSLGEGLSNKIAERLSRQLSVSVYSLAKAGHTTLDSRIKMQELAKINFDFVVVYHGINDSRANNIPGAFFDQDYRHFKFYREVLLCVDYPSKKWFTTPFAVAFIKNSFEVEVEGQPFVPPFFHIEGDSVANTQYWNEGRVIKSAKTFKRNLHIIRELAQQKGQLILMTYAYYQPEDYSLQKFIAKALDYDEQKWPTEIYGRPENVVAALQTHNKVVRQVAAEERIPLIDIESKIPHSRLYFHDICHLTDKGCMLMEEELAHVIVNELVSRPDYNALQKR